MAKEIKFNVKLLVDGKEQLTTATADIKELKKGFDNTRQSVRAVNDLLLNFNQKMEAVRNVFNEVTAASGKIKEWQQGFVTAARVTGLAGDELAAVRGKAQALADTFGGDLTETIRSANALARGFGVSFDEALKLMRDGFVAGADANGEFLDTLREYPRYFKEAGISAEEFVAITTNAAKQGIYSDKGVDTIKEGNLRIREMTTATAAALEGIGISATDVQAQLQAGTMTTFQVMQMVAAKLKELPASASVVGTAIADIFGGPGEDAGLEYIKSLADIELSMDAVREGADEYSKALGDQADAQANLNTVLSGAQEALVALNAKYGTLMNAASGVLSVSADAVISFTAVSAALQKSTVAMKAMSLAAAEWNRVGKLCKAVNIALGASGHTAAAGAIALKIALRGLLIATGIGAVIWAATEAIEALVNAMSGTEEAGNKAADGLTASQRAAKDTAEAFKSKLGAEAASLQSKYAQLQAAWKSLKTEHEKTAWIKNNGAEFSALGLQIDSVAKAEDVFVDKTKDVVDALNKRAEAAAHAAMVEELYKKKLELQDRIQDRNDKATAMHSKRTYKKGDVVNINDPVFKNGALKVGALSGLAMRNAYNDKYTLTDKGAKQANSFFDGKNYINTGAAQKADMAALEQTTKDIDKHLQAQVASEKAATGNKENKENRESRESRYSSRDVGTSDVKTEIAGARSEEALKSNISYYEEMRSKVEGNAQAYAEWTQKILDAQDALKEVQSAGDKVGLMHTLKGEVSAAAKKNDFSDLEEESEPKEVKVTGDFEGLNEAVDEAEERLRPFREEVEGLQSLTAQGLTLEVKDMGVASLTDRIKELKKALEDTRFTDSQKKEIEGLIDTYKNYRKKAAVSFDTVKEGWSGVKGIGSGIQSITDALSGNQDAWSAVCTVVDSAIQIYEGIKGVIEIIDALTGAKEGETQATQQQSTAQALENAQKTTGVALSGEKAAAELTEAGAAVTNTGAKSGEAVANVTSEGAKLAFPYNLIAIAAGVSAVIAALANISKFATGGIVGGSSTSGDKVLARVNSGEMILNRSQQKRLFDLLNGRIATPTLSGANVGGYDVPLDVDGLRSSLYGASPQTIKIVGRTRGKDIVYTMANTTRIWSKSGRRTNIRL